MSKFTFFTLVCTSLFVVAGCASIMPDGMNGHYNRLIETRVGKYPQASVQAHDTSAQYADSILRTPAGHFQVYFPTQPNGIPVDYSWGDQSGAGDVPPATGFGDERSSESWTTANGEGGKVYGHGSEYKYVAVTPDVDYYSSSERNGNLDTNMDAVSARAALQDICKNSVPEFGLSESGGRSNIRSTEGQLPGLETQGALSKGSGSFRMRLFADIPAGRVYKLVAAGGDVNSPTVQKFFDSFRPI
jgi:hypothetical protein